MLLVLDALSIAKFGGIIVISILNLFSCKHENQNVFLKIEINIGLEKSHCIFNKRIVTKEDCLQNQTGNTNPSYSLKLFNLISKFHLY